MDSKINLINKLILGADCRDSCNKRFMGGRSRNRHPEPKHLTIFVCSYMCKLTIVLLYYVLSSSYISGIMSGPEHTCFKCLQMVISKRFYCLCAEGVRSRKGCESRPFYGKLQNCGFGSPVETRAFLATVLKTCFD